MNDIVRADAGAALRDERLKSRHETAAATVDAAPGVFAQLLDVADRPRGDRPAEKPSDPAETKSDRGRNPTAPPLRHNARVGPETAAKLADATVGRGPAAPETPRDGSATEESAAQRPRPPAQTAAPGDTPAPAARPVEAQPGPREGSPPADDVRAATEADRKDDAKPEAEAAPPAASDGETKTAGADGGQGAAAEEAAPTETDAPAPVRSATGEPVAAAVAGAPPSPPGAAASATAENAAAAAPQTADSLSQQVTAQVAGPLVARLGDLGGQGSLRLTLSPPELGRVEISFTREGDRLQLAFRVSSAEAAQALQDGTAHLQKMLLGGKSPWQQIDITVEHEDENAGRRDPEGRGGRSRRDGDGARPRGQDPHGGER